MEQKYTSVFTEEERAARRAERAAARQKKQQAQRRQLLRQLVPVLALLLLLMIGLAVWIFQEKSAEAEAPEDPLQIEPMLEPEPQESSLPYSAIQTADTAHLGEELPSAYAVVIDLTTDTILAEKNAQVRINPASMTKILTLLVAAEHVTDYLDDSFTMTIDITDYCYVNKCSVVGLEIGETVSIQELLYGTILPSGADAALGLATYVAGSHEAFVELMNQKLEELGLSDTAHFTNCVGLYDEDHYCTVYDMALILKAAMDNKLCREILGARTYDTLPTPYHEKGQTLSNWFIRRIEDKFDKDVFQVIGAKTGYVTQSGNCAASCGRDANGNEYICVTGNSYSYWRAIYDHVELYSAYCHGVLQESDTPV